MQRCHVLIRIVDTLKRLWTMGHREELVWTSNDSQATSKSFGSHEYLNTVHFIYKAFIGSHLFIPSRHRRHIPLATARRFNVLITANRLDICKRSVLSLTFLAFAIVAALALEAGTEALKH